MIRPGIEQLAADPPAGLRGKKLALLCNQASTDHRFVHSRDIIHRLYPGSLACLFSPQHGFFSEKQDNMIESDHMRDPVSGLPVYSLYAESRRPDLDLFRDLDVLLVDLPDVGTRVYTFAWTVVYCLQAAASTDTRVIVLDRPNPIGGHLVEGNLLREECFSFVGLHSIPMRHGLTLGELVLLCNREMGIGARLDVIPTAGWRRSVFQDENIFPWVFPSPNMPSFTSALLYPGQVIWEGTNVSEGRGTTLPFQLFGAPYLDHGAVLDFLKSTPLPGCVLRPLVFEPTSGKWSGQACAGFQIHVTDRERFRPYRTGLALLQAILRLFPEQFACKEPPYEYEYERLPLDLIIGDRAVRGALEDGADILELEHSWENDLREFGERCRALFLYGGD
ncbi:MAG: DUF1343 domain-containing protein [Desulfobulbaceae bacterium]